MSWLIVGCILYILLVLAERAILAVTPYETEMLRAEGTPSARRALSVIGDQSRQSLAALAIGQVFLTILVVLFGVDATLKWSPLAQWLSHQPSGAAYAVGIMVAGIVVLFFWQIGRIHLRRLKQPIAGKWLLRLYLAPVVCAALFKPFLPKDKKNTPEPDTDIQSKKQNTEKRRDIEMLKSIAKFGEVSIRQVMQPRPKIIALDQQATFPEVLETIRNAGFSRLPVFEESLDNVVGILYIKDLAGSVNESPDFPWQKLIRADIMVVPETKPINELLQAFKKQKKHLALVVDEYGGASGLVTLEDILEEVTGEIRDEFDEGNEIPPYEQIDAQHFRFAGATMINDVCQITGIDPATFETVRADADTIAGLLLELAGEIPVSGAQIRWGQYLFTVEKADKRKIEAVLMTIEG